LTGEKAKETHKQILESLTSLFGGSLALRDGKIFFLDESVSPAPLKTEIRSLNFELSKVSYRRAFPFGINGTIIHSKKDGQFSINGTIENIPEDLDFSKGRIQAEIKIKGIETFHFWPYLKTLLPMKMISGILDLEADFQGDLQ
jgi:hypothetical protein